MQNIYKNISIKCTDHLAEEIMLECSTGLCVSHSDWRESNYSANTKGHMTDSLTKHASTLFDFKQQLANSKQNNVKYFSMHETVFPSLTILSR